MSEEEEIVRRVRSLLKLASNKGGCVNQTPKERRMKETEHWKDMFRKCDTSGSGTLGFNDVKRMIRKHMQITERVVSDQQLQLFFSALDEDGGGAVEFNEFLEFINRKDENSRLKDIVLKKVTRTVRLALAKKKMSMAQLEERFNNASAEGLIDTPNPDGSLGPEEMRRFFRKVLGVTEHETTDKDLVIAFRAMDEDGGGTLDADEFMAFIRAAVEEESSLFVSVRTGQQLPDLIGGMRTGMRGPFRYAVQAHDTGAQTQSEWWQGLPARSPRARPGTTFTAATAHVPFCIHGRDLPSQARHDLGTPMFLQPVKPSSPTKQDAPAFSRSFSSSALMSPRSQSSALLPSGLPKLAGASYPPTPMFRSASMPGMLDSGHASPPASPSAGHHGELLSPKSTSSVPPKVVKEDPSSRTKSYLYLKDGDVLNRIEENLEQAGVNVRGFYHKLNSNRKPGH